LIVSFDIIRYSAGNGERRNDTNPTETKGRSRVLSGQTAWNPTNTDRNTLETDCAAPVLRTNLRKPLFSDADATPKTFGIFAVAGLAFAMNIAQVPQVAADTAEPKL
jgi:hypothetical protein